MKIVIIRTLSLLSMSALVCANASAADSAPIATFAEGTVTTIHYHTHIEGKRGVLQDIHYDAELQPDPEDPTHATGIGHYSGMVVYHNTNCANKTPDNPVQVPVNGDLQAEARLGQSLNDLDGPPAIRYTFTTLDWRLNPWVFDPSIYGEETDWTTYYASTPEQIEMDAGLGSVSNSLMNGTPITGNPTVHHSKNPALSNKCDGDLFDEVDEEISVVPEEDVVKAVPDVSTLKFRGEKAVLDGSRSMPSARLKTYRWKFEPGADCPAGIPTVEFDGKRVEVQLLCSARATLTVSLDGSGNNSILPNAASGSRSDSKIVNLPIKPRPWKTRFSQMPSIGQLTSAPPLLSESGAVNMYGRNVCAYDGLTGDQYSGHKIHFGATAEKTNIENAVTFQQVKDPNSPVNGWWFVGSKTFEVARAALIHPSLNPYSELQIKNKTLCAKEKVSPCGFDMLMASTRAHEIMHGTLMQEKMAELTKTGKDPAQLIERMINKDKESIPAYQALSDFEDQLDAATTEDKVHARLKQVDGGRFNVPGFIWLPTSTSPDAEYKKVYFDNFADTGD